MKHVLSVIFTFLAGLLPGVLSANPVSYEVTAAFDEPSYNRDTVFTGSFTWDNATRTLIAMTGKMNQVMASTEQTLWLGPWPTPHNGNIVWAYDQATNSVTVTVFKNPAPSISVYNNSTYNPIPTITINGQQFPNPETDGSQNAYFTVNFNASNPALVSTSNTNKLVYGDCVGISLMGTTCMTGISTGGSMGGIPISLTINQSKPTAVPIPTAAFWILGLLMAGISAIVSFRRR